MASLAMSCTLRSFSALSISSKICAGNESTCTKSSIKFPTKLHSGLSSSSSYSQSIQVKSSRISCVRSPVFLVIAEDKKPKKKVDTAIKRAKQSLVRRLYNRSRKSEMGTRMKKAFLALEELQKSENPVPEQLLPIEKLIGEAYSIIDKSVKVGTIHKNKGARRKARLAKAKNDVSIALGWYTPEPAPSSS